MWVLILNIKTFLYSKKYILYSVLAHFIIALFCFVLFKTITTKNISPKADNTSISVSLVKSFKPFNQKKITNKKDSLLTKDNILTKQESSFSVDQSNVAQQNQGLLEEDNFVMLDYSFVLSVGDNKKPNYPITAKINNWQGEVKLLLKTQNGKVEQVNILQSSNFDILDLEAVKTAKTWQLGYDANGAFIISIIFKLNKNN